MSTIATNEFVASGKFYSAVKMPGKNPSEEQKPIEKKEKAENQPRSLSAAGLAWSGAEEQPILQAQALSYASDMAQKSAEPKSKDAKNKSNEAELFWGGELGDLSLLSTAVLLKTRAVNLPAVLISSLEEFRRRLQARLMESFEESYAGCFSHNRLLSNLYSVKAGFFAEILARLQVSAEEIDRIRARVRKKLCEQNRLGVAQVIYDETLLDLIT